MADELQHIREEHIRQKLDELAAREYVQLKRAEREQQTQKEYLTEHERDSWFSKWVADGRVTFIMWLITTLMWAGFSAFTKEPPPALNQVWILVSGLLVGHLTMAKETRKKRK